MKTVLITGGTGLLGTAVVTRLASDYRCVVLYHGDKGWDALQKKVQGRIEGIQADVSNDAQVVAAVAEVGELHAVVHLVGGFDSGSVTSDSAAWSKMLSLNLLSAVSVFRAAGAGWGTADRDQLAGFA